MTAMTGNEIATDRRPKLLWVGDAVVKTGFATVCHCALEQLRRAWDVGVIGINHDGDPHPWPYPIWPARRNASEDIWGLARFADVVAKFEPDVVLVNNDPWVVADFVARWWQIEKKPALTCYTPVDTPRAVKREVSLALSRIDAVGAYTAFGIGELSVDDAVPQFVVPHGVNLSRFFPVDRDDARRAAGLWPIVGKDFVIGNVNRNQPRKRLDLTIEAFAAWIVPNNIRDAWLYLHCDKGDVGWDIGELARRHGVEHRVIYPAKFDGAAGDEAMRVVYGMLDANVTTTLGEGWGLTQLEAAACGLPQVAPRWSALGEWLTKGAIMVEPRRIEPISGQRANGDGGIVEPGEVADAMHVLYENHEFRRRLSREALELSRRREYRWESVGRGLDEMLRAAINKRFGLKEVAVA